jgi:hypothetical protein
LIFNQKLNIMRLLKMFFVLMIAAMAIGLSSCAKEEVSPPVVDGGASEMIYANAGGERGPEPDPDEDCRCEFRFLTYANLPGSGTWSFAIWDGSMPELEVQFNGNQYQDPNSGLFSGVYPSPFFDIPNGSGWVTFAFLEALITLPSNATIRIQIDCYLQNDDGTETLATTSYYDFVKSDGVEDPLGGVFVFDPIFTSCLDQFEL